MLEELEGVVKGDVFGSVLDLEKLKMDFASDVMIPGVAVASSRATPLAGEHSLILQLISVSFNPIIATSTYTSNIYFNLMILVICSAWTNALEIASLEVDTQRSCLVLSTGVADR